MSHLTLLRCDGCGQAADSAHLSRRLERLAWATRFRPIHVQALFLGGVAPAQDSGFLYAPDTSFGADAGRILQGAQISTEGRSREGVQSEFQKQGLVLTYVLECPLMEGTSGRDAQTLLEKQIGATIMRIRRSIKPKRLVLFSRELLPLAPTLRSVGLDCAILPGQGTFLSSQDSSSREDTAFLEALSSTKGSTI